VCLIVLAIGQSERYPIILAGNRDEFHNRPTAKANWWADKKDIVGGRDLQAGGSWLALQRSGRFAAVTNFRDGESTSARFRSRGHLVTDFLEGKASPVDFVNSIDGGRYAGFNLIVGDTDRVAYVSNRGAGPRALEPGIYGLSNALLDEPWDKVERSKASLRALLATDTVNETTLLRLLNDRAPGPIEEAQSGPLDFAAMRAITAPFIVTPHYGTRCSTIVLADTARSWHVTERRFDAAGAAVGDSRYTLVSAPPLDQDSK
jgi:uncharacterized protein with NRDE domain